MSWATRRYIRVKEDLEFNRGQTEQEMKASDLRKRFLTTYVVNFDTFLYKTQVERDWAYIAKREHRYDVTIKSLTYGFLCANLTLVAALFVKKRMVWWPLPTVTLAGYIYFQPIMLQKHSKKLFDMCNVGEEYYFGKKRNEVLRQCNEILNQEDF